MSQELPPVSADKFRLHLSPRLTNVVREAAAEQIGMILEQDKQPHSSFMELLEVEDGKVIRATGLTFFESLADFLQRYADDTERTATNIDMSWPADIAGTLIAKREISGTYAEATASFLRDDLRVQHEIGECLVIPEEWLA